MLTKQQIHQVCIGLRLGSPHKAIAVRTGCSLTSIQRISKHNPARVVFFGDSHCGSNVGLTPPAYQYKYISNPKTEELRTQNKWAKLQKECWGWYINKLSMLKPIDHLLVMGDLIDGDGKRSGGTEPQDTHRTEHDRAMDRLEESAAKGNQSTQDIAAAFRSLG